MLPVELAQAAETALTKLAEESAPVAVKLLEKLAEPHVPHDVLVAIEKIVEAVIRSPYPKTTAERATIAIASSVAADRAAEELVR